jgi:hypothetical protein
MREQVGDEVLQNEETSYIVVEAVLWPRHIGELEQFLRVVGCGRRRSLCSYKDDGAQIDARCKGAGGKPNIP